MEGVSTYLRYMHLQRTWMVFFFFQTAVHALVVDLLYVLKYLTAFTSMQ